MGAIARSIANNITTSGVFTSSAITNSSVTGITVLANAADGITFISSQTASNSASISFTSGISSTYKAYKFIFSNIFSKTHDQNFRFNLSTDSGSNYNVAKTGTFFRAYHIESPESTVLQYEAGRDIPNGTGYAYLSGGVKGGANTTHTLIGDMILFNPSSTSYHKQWFSKCEHSDTTNGTQVAYTGGYALTASAINAIRFQFDTGNLDGTIYMYGIK